MSKPRSVAVSDGNDNSGRQNKSHDSQPQKPLSGSKTVKNQNHSRHNHGEGS